MEHNCQLPLVTVVTSVYRKRESIFECIESVCIQRYPKIEYILIDDGPNSVDEAEIRPYLDSSENIIRYTIVHNCENLGISSSLNVATNLSEGKYVFNLADDDCFYDQNVLGDWVEEFERTGADIITAKRAVFDGKLSIQKRIDPDEKTIKHLVFDSPSQLFEKMCAHNIIFGCSTAKSRKILTQYPYDSRYRIIEDYPVALRMLRKGIKIYFYDRIVIRYREGGTSNVCNIDRAYMKESNRIFMRDVLPYAHKKIKAILAYLRWKRSMKKQKQALIALQKEGLY
jgi:GT2 family glycosyltransferase